MRARIAALSQSINSQVISKLFCDPPPYRMNSRIKNHRISDFDVVCLVTIRLEAFVDSRITSCMPSGEVESLLDVATCSII